MRTFSIEEQKEICDMYINQGLTMDFIRRKFHCRSEAVRSILISNDIKIKKRALSKNRLFKEDFFEKIDCEEKAYLLGLFFSDGSITLDKKRSPNIRLELKISDVDLLLKIKELLNIGSKLIYNKRKGKETVTLSIRNSKMANDLSKYGIIPNKTYLTKNLPLIPEEFEKHFLRGLIDGDGSIYYSKGWKIDFCSYHYQICEDFKKLSNKYLNVNNNTKIANYGTAYHYRINKKNLVKQMATVLYKDSKISLARKYRLAMAILEDKTDEDIVYSDS